MSSGVLWASRGVVVGRMESVIDDVGQVATEYPEGFGLGIAGCDASLDELLGAVVWTLVAQYGDGMFGLRG